MATDTVDSREAKRRFLELAEELDRDGLEAHEIFRGIQHAALELFALGWAKFPTTEHE